MFERFTDSARRLVVEAQDHAHRREDERIGVEHLLLAACEPDDGGVSGVLSQAGITAATFGAFLDNYDESDELESIGVDLAAVSSAADSAFGDGALERASKGSQGRRGLLRRSLGNSKRFTNEAKVVLEQSLHVSLAHRHKVIADAHVVIAVLDSRHGPVARFIRLGGIDVSDVKSGLVVRIAGPHS